MARYMRLAITLEMPEDEDGELYEGVTDAISAVLDLVPMPHGTLGFEFEHDGGLVAAMREDGSR